MSFDRSFDCGSCGKRFRWKPQLAGRRVKCACGAVVEVPHEALEVFADEAIDAPPLVRPPAAARTPVVADAAAVAARLGIAVPARKRGKTEAELALEERAALDELARPSLVRDVIIPIPVIAAGLLLQFLQASRWSATPRGAADAVVLTVLGAILAVGMILVAMWMLTHWFDVNFLGSFGNCVLRLCAIAVGPMALREIAIFHIGDGIGGPFVGAVLTLAAYGALFWALMRVDLKDATVCTIVTFGVVMLASYIAFRAEGMRRGSDI